MQNKLTVTIDGQSYTLVSEQEIGYMEKVAAYVDEKVTALRADGQLSGMDALILVALNVADDYFKCKTDGERLRGQLKEYVEEAADLKMKLSEAKREMFKLEHRKK